MLYPKSTVEQQKESSNKVYGNFFPKLRTHTAWFQSKLKLFLHKANKLNGLIMLHDKKLRESPHSSSQWFQDLLLASNLCTICTEILNIACTATTACFSLCLCGSGRGLPGRAPPPTSTPAPDLLVNPAHLPSIQLIHLQFKRQGSFSTSCQIAVQVRPSLCVWGHFYFGVFFLIRKGYFPPPFIPVCTRVFYKISLSTGHKYKRPSQNVGLQGDDKLYTGYQGRTFCPCALSLFSCGAVEIRRKVRKQAVTCRKN